LEVKKMQKRTFCFFGLLVILLFGSSRVGAESNFCPDPSGKGQTVLDLPLGENPALGGKEILVSEKSASIKRNQVLLEVAEGTW
jgi:hypothetical protein